MSLSVVASEKLRQTRRMPRWKPADHRGAAKDPSTPGGPGASRYSGRGPVSCGSFPRRTMRLPENFWRGILLRGCGGGHFSRERILETVRFASHIFGQNNQRGLGECEEAGGRSDSWTVGSGDRVASEKSIFNLKVVLCGRGPCGARLSRYRKHRHHRRSQFCLLPTVGGFVGPSDRGRGIVRLPESHFFYKNGPHLWLWLRRGSVRQSSD